MTNLSFLLFELFYHGNFFQTITISLYLLFHLQLIDYFLGKQLWQLLSIRLMCKCFWFWHLIWDFPFWIFLGVHYFCYFTFYQQAGYVDCFFFIIWSTVLPESFLLALPVIRDKSYNIIRTKKMNIYVWSAG